MVSRLGRSVMLMVRLLTSGVGPCGKFDGFSPNRLKFGEPVIDTLVMFGPSVSMKMIKADSGETLPGRSSAVTRMVRVPSRVKKRGSLRLIVDRTLQVPF